MGVLGNRVCLLFVFLLPVSCWQSAQYTDRVEMACRFCVRSSGCHFADKALTTVATSVFGSGGSTTLLIF